MELKKIFFATVQDRKEGRGTKKKGEEKNKRNRKMVALNPTLANITLNINELNRLIKRSALILLGLKAESVTADRSSPDLLSSPDSWDIIFTYFSSYLTRCVPAQCPSPGTEA